MSSRSIHKQKLGVFVMTETKVEKSWKAWVLKRNRLTNVLDFIKHKVPEVDKYFYPIARKEYSTKSGSKKVRERPMFEGYLFLHYDDNLKVYEKLKSYPFITTYAGPVRDKEIEDMVSRQGQLIREKKESIFRKADRVILLDGPFKGHKGVVDKASYGSVRVLLNIELLGKTVEVVCLDSQLEKEGEIEGGSVVQIRAQEL